MREGLPIGAAVASLVLGASRGSSGRDTFPAWLDRDWPERGESRSFLCIGRALPRSSRGASHQLSASEAGMFCSRERGRSCS